MPICARSSHLPLSPYRFPRPPSECAGGFADDFYQRVIQLPERAQVLFISGVLEGIAFTNYSRPDYGKWAECVRKATIGTLLKQVIAMTVVDGDASNQPVPWLVVRAIGARDCPR